MTFDVSRGRCDPAAVEALLPAEKKRRKQVEAQEWFCLSEFWAQIYVREHAGALGVTVIEPIRPSGPDFRVSSGNAVYFIEVEKRWDDYLRHRHHLDPKYEGVHVLAVLCPDEPLKPLACMLPPRTLVLPLDAFLRWHAASHARFAGEVNELQQGQHLSHRLATLSFAERRILRLQELIRAIESNEMPGAGEAREQLAKLLGAEGDTRAERVRAISLPRRSALVDAGLLSDAGLREELRIELRDLFPEADERVDMKTRVRHRL